MKIKPILALSLVCTSLCGLLSLPVGAGATAQGFADISDAQVAESAEILRLLGIVNGTSAGLFQPERTLSRAEFCKIAVELMGNGDQAAAQMNRTVFKDVPSTHWARGYINVATQSTEDQAAIIRGDAYGNFSPDAPISYAEAVTILLRILGYSDATVGYGTQWYDGYLITAGISGLSTDLDLEADQSLTRGEMARLLDNFLHTPKVGEDEAYLYTALGCTATDEMLVFDTDAITPDGTTGAIEVEGGEMYKTDRTPFPADLIGRRVSLILDDKDKILAVEPATQGTSTLMGILSCTYNSVKLAGNQEIEIKPETLVWQDGEETTFQAVYQDLPAGTQAIFQYAASAKLEYLFLRTPDPEDTTTTVLKAGVSTQMDLPLYKNGLPALPEDLRPYDVTTHDPVNNVVYASDLRISGIYENAYPSPTTPATITVLGHAFPVLSMASADLQNFEIGDRLTILLTHDGQVAGAVGLDVATSNVTGVVESIDETTGQAVITPLTALPTAQGDPIQFEGATSYTGSRAAPMVGQLVTLSSNEQGRLSLDKLEGTASKNSLNMTTRKIGPVSLADNVVFYERVGNSQPNLVDESQITLDVIPANQIAYFHTNYAGQADVVLLDNATGDQFEYGFLKFNQGDSYSVEVDTDGDGINDSTQSFKTQPDTITVKNLAQPQGTGGYYTLAKPKANLPVGIVGSLTVGNAGVQRLEAMVELQVITNVKSSAFQMSTETLVTPDAVYPIAQNVQCYNAITKSWFAIPEHGDAMDALNDARAFAETLTVYYDKSPDLGGKIRLIVVEN